MRVWFVVGRMDWSYSINARAVAAHLPWESRIVATAAEVDAAPSDVVLDMWWRGTAQHPRLIRQVSSHRWAHGPGRLTPAALVKRHLRDARVVIVPSQRLETLLSPLCSVIRTPKGFDPEAFFDRGGRGGPLAIGWAGAVKPDKGLPLLKQACPDLRIATRLPYAEMPHWYSSLDVITCASIAEGDPRPLIEGMACGCFPVTTDVGVAGELISNGGNGLIVERSVSAFREAFQWCAANVERVRAAGRRNAEQMRETRTWGHVAGAWREAIARCDFRRGSPAEVVE